MINWGIIGCGDVTEVKSGPAFNKVRGSRLIAVMRRDADKASDYAARHNVAKWYSNADQLIEDPDVNAIYIATPPDSHEVYAIKALRAGKPVYVEKPFTLDAAGAERVKKVADETGVKLSVAHYRRQQPLFLKVKELIAYGAVGKPIVANLLFFQPHHAEVMDQAKYAWRVDPAISGGGFFHDLAPHQLDLMIYFFGTPVKTTGIACNAGGYYAADDTVSGQVLFQNNIVFNGSWSFCVAERRDTCEIIGTEGKLSFSVFGHQPIIVSKEGTEQQLTFELLQHVQQPMIQRVVEYFSGQAENPCTAEEGIEVMRMMDQMTMKNW